MSAASVQRDEPVPVQPAASSDVRYIGLATRTVAFAIDAAIINVVAIVIEVAAALIISLFHLPHDVVSVIKFIGAGAWIVWIVGYFVAFWSTPAGETPGNRVMKIRVVATDGRRIKPRRAFLRCVGLVLAALPLFAGYLMILFNRRRRGLQDYLARTVVVESPSVSLAEVRRMRRRAERAAASAASGAPDRSPQSGDDRRALASQT